MGSGEAASFGLVGCGPVTIPQTLVALFCLCNLPGIHLLSWRAVDWNRLGPARWDLNSLFFPPGSPEFPCLLGECVPGGVGWEGAKFASGGRGLCTAGVPLCCFCWPGIAGGLARGLFFSAVNSLLHPPQWRYCIRLENLDSDVVQLRERHWRIFSLSGTLETVRGRGVVGRVSIIRPVMASFWSFPAALGAECLLSSPLWLGTEASV